ncbi:MAG: DOMON-like domain-containing protein [Steroidobacteraceae bacterium]
MQALSLVPHPSTPATPVQAVVATLEAGPGGSLEYTVRIEAPRQALAWPASRPAAFRDELWRHTCVELFARADEEAYREFNFSPSSEYALYDFDGYRSGMRPVPASRGPVIRWREEREAMTINTLIPGELFEVHRRTPSALALAAVIETLDGRQSFWALHHPARKPDFHHRDGFILHWPASRPQEPVA